MKTESSKAKSSKMGMSGLLEAAGWGLFFIWVGISSLGNFGWGIGLLGIGVLMLSAQAMRKYFDLTVSRTGIMFGVCFSMAGILQLFDIQLDKAPFAAWVVPILFIAAGISIFISMWLRKPSV